MATLAFAGVAIVGVWLCHLLVVIDREERHAGR